MCINTAYACAPNMYSNTIQVFADKAVQKINALKRQRWAFLINSALGGMYIGLGIILIFSLASGMNPTYQKLAMGVSFGVALTLVIFAGAELFTGHTMYMTFGYLRRQTNLRDMFSVWINSWVGNLIGSVGLALIFAIGGGIEQIAHADSFLQKAAAYKMNLPAQELIAKGLLCNFLVCLALWMSERVDSDSARCIVVFWCLFTFIASGYEHCVANMALLSIALMGEHTSAVSVLGLAHNLLWVTFGNIIGGAVFVALGYWSAAKNEPL